ncbi:uncharacterized protein isoform X2 [Rhodnius prolixus]|uniref:uncharacterized protein isoform X2 n=1 Tax=Rhodnius prolixus TaxID=13249 RepID=UPI003D188962
MVNLYNSPRSNKYYKRFESNCTNLQPLQTRKLNENCKQRKMEEKMLQTESLIYSIENSQYWEYYLQYCPSNEEKMKKTLRKHPVKILNTSDTGVLPAKLFINRSPSEIDVNHLS